MVIFLLLPLFLAAGEFTASVKQNLGDSITLNLTLKEATAKANPSFDVLKQAFSIQSESHGTNTTIINGTVSSSTSWKLDLIPKVKGEVEIPAVYILTSEGVLSSKPLKIKIELESNQEEFHLAQQLSNEKPYKNQPFIYTLRLNSKYDLSNLQVEKLQIPEAIVEVAKTGELKYIITPLKSGTLKIPSLQIRGEIVDRTVRDPFARLWGFSQLKPFALHTEEKVIEVQPPVAQPWLPAHALKVEETWDENQRFQLGEPLSWGIKVHAVGVKSSQLPPLHLADPSFKIYADKPEVGDEVRDEMLESFRKDHFTLIPTASGLLTLPDVVIHWWDVDNEQMVATALPKRQIQVLPAIEKEKTEVMAPQVIVVETHSSFLYGVIAVLSGLLLAALVYLFFLRSKLKKEKKKDTLPDLNPT